MEEDIIRVLYLDDEEPNLFSFKAAFRRDFEVHTCDEPHKAVRMLDDHEFHVVLSDQRMPRISGWSSSSRSCPTIRTSAACWSLATRTPMRWWTPSTRAGLPLCIQAVERGGIAGRHQGGPRPEPRQGQQCLTGSPGLSALDSFAAEAERLQGMAQASGDGLAHSLAADLRQLEEGIRAERVRYGKWIAEQQGKA